MMMRIEKSSLNNTTINGQQRPTLPPSQIDNSCGTSMMDSRGPMGDKPTPQKNNSCIT